MKIGAAEALWSDAGLLDLFKQFKALIIKCIDEDSTTRITAAEALKHPVFSSDLKLSDEESTFLPSSVLLFTRLSSETTDEKDSFEHLVEEIGKQCRAFGGLQECRLTDQNQIFAFFNDAENAIYAKRCFSSKSSTSNFDIDDNFDIIDGEADDADENLQDVIYIDEHKFKVSYYI